MIVIVMVVSNHWSSNPTGAELACNARCRMGFDHRLGSSCCVGWPAAASAFTCTPPEVAVLNGLCNWAGVEQAVATGIVQSAAVGHHCPQCSTLPALC